MIRSKRVSTGDAELLIARHARSSARKARKRKRKGRAWTIIWLRPKDATMSLDDIAAQGKPDAHTAILRRVERVEEFVHALRVNTNAGISYTHPHAVAISRRADDQLARPIIDATHRVRGVKE